MSISFIIVYCLLFKYITILPLIESNATPIWYGVIKYNASFGASLYNVFPVDIECPAYKWTPLP